MGGRLAGPVRHEAGACAPAALGRRSDLPFLAHRDGVSWSNVTVPGGSTPGTLEALSATSGSDVWAVGTGDAGPLALHFDGSSWIWAVGDRDGALADGFAVERTFTLHWDGMT